MARKGRFGKWVVPHAHCAQSVEVAISAARFGCGSGSRIRVFLNDDSDQGGGPFSFILGFLVLEVRL